MDTKIVLHHVLHSLLVAFQGFWILMCNVNYFESILTIAMFS